MDFQSQKSEYISVFEKYEDPAISYLKDHAHRFIRTRELVLSRLKTRAGVKMMDIASHWLHNAFLYAQDGFEVTALDQLGGEISAPTVIRFANDHGIKLLPCKELNNPLELETVANNTFDLVMLTETIEHMTFNPVRFWTLIYKKMKEGGKIIITTPNYYYFKGAFRKDLEKIFSGHSPGISIHDVVWMQDYAPHWKEFSKKDMVEYFSCLSPDFRMTQFVYNDLYAWDPENAFIRFGKKRAPKFFNPTMYVEIELLRKDAGILAVPHC